MGSTLSQWPGSYIFGNCEVTSLYMGILTLRLCHFEPRSCRWPKAGWESLQTNATAATALEFHTIKVLGRIYVYMGILTLRLCHFEPRSCRWPKAGWESLQTNATAATALEFHTIKVLGRIYGGITPV